MESHQFFYDLHTNKYDDDWPSKSDTSNEDFSDNEHKPPLYSYEELTQNLVAYDEISTRNVDSDTSDQQSDKEDSANPSNLENIRKLSQLIADCYCKTIQENQNLEIITQNLNAELSKLQFNAETETNVPQTQGSAPILNKTVEQDNASLKQIYMELKTFLTQEYCYVCYKSNSPKKNCHYNNKVHIKKVRKWLENKMYYLKKRLDVRYLFCDACNLPLPGNEQARHHYGTTEHLENSKTFCNVCLRVIPLHNISTHINQKGHIKNLNKNKEFIILEPFNTQVSIPNENLFLTQKYNAKQHRNIDTEKCSSAPTSTLKSVNVSESSIINENFIASEENFPKLSDVYSKKHKTAEEIKSELHRLLLPDFCHICNSENVPEKNYIHYKTENHIYNTRIWLEKAIKKMQNPVDLNLLYCETCNLPLSGDQKAKEHYISTYHSQMIAAFKFADHCQSRTHLRLQKEAEEGENVLVDDREKCSLTATSTLKSNHVSESSIINENFIASEDNFPKLSDVYSKKHKTAEDIKKELHTLLLPDFCHICNGKNVPEKNYFHYKTENHIYNTRIWLEKAIKKMQNPVDLNLLYCETCNLPLSGDQKAKEHYISTYHAENGETYCNVCSRMIAAFKFADHCQSTTHLRLQKEAEEGVNVADVEKEIKDLEGIGTFEEANQNNEAVNFKNNEDSKSTKSDTSVHLVQNPEDDKITNPQPGTPEFISIKLSGLLNSKKCQICSGVRMKSRHLKKKHFENVRKWLEKEIATLHTPIETALLFCEVCNLPLAGNNSAQIHYDSTLHIDNLEKFCKVCCRSIEGTLQEHLKSKKHLQNLEAEDHLTTENKEEKINEEMSPENTNEKSSYANALKKQSHSESESPANKETIIKKDPQPVKQYQRLSSYVLKFLDKLFCYVCNQPAAPAHHYDSQLHNLNMRKWLEGNRNILALFDIQDFEELVCIACRFVFHDSLMAQKHYSSEAHKHTMMGFCKKCLLHEDNLEHKEHNKELEADESRKNKEKLIIIDPSVILASNLTLMFTPVFCEICHISITTININHYTEKGHILMVRTWLAYGMQNLQIAVDPTLIYCEACSLILCGTPSAKAHYIHPNHLINYPLYCSNCIFRGSPDEMLRHFMSMEHRIKFDNAVQNSNLSTKPFMEPPRQNIFYQSTPTLSTINNPNLNAISLPLSATINISKFIELISRSNLPGEKDLHNEMDLEVKKLLELLYYSDKTPLEYAVSYLKVINEELIERIKENK